MFSSLFELEETWVFQQTHQFTILKNGAYLVTTLLLQKLKITWQDKHSVMNLAHVCVKIWKKNITKTIIPKYYQGPYSGVNETGSKSK